MFQVKRTSYAKASEEGQGWLEPVCGQERDAGTAID